MDLEALLRLKAEAVAQLRAAIPVDEANRQLQAELAKESHADRAIVEGCLRVIVARMYPNRLRQIEAQFAEGSAGRRVLCVVDFAAIPYSFNILVFLMVANKYRIEIGADVLDVAMIGHASDPQIDGQRHHSIDALKNRFRVLAHNMGIAATRLVPSIGSVLFFDNRTLFSKYIDTTRDQYAVFPGYYDPKFPTVRTSDDQADNFCFIHLTDAQRPEDVLTLAPPAEELALARRWLRKHVYPAAPITVTLRNISFEPMKNSDPGAWMDIIRRVSDPRVKFVIVPDYYDAFGEERIVGDNVVYCHEATLTLPLRTAIYAASSFNIFGNNGPLSIGYLSQIVKYLIFLDAVDVGGSSAEEIKKGEGLVPGGQFWGATEFQRLVWETKDPDRMARAISAMIDDLGRRGCLIPDWYAASD